MSKYQITWYTQLDNGYVHERTIYCKNKFSACHMYDELAKQDNTLSIEMEEL